MRKGIKKPARMTDEEWYRVKWLFKLTFTLAFCSTLFYGLFDWQFLTAMWFGIAGGSCVAVGGLLYVLRKTIAGWMAPFLIGLGFISGAGIGMFLAGLY